MGSQLVQVKNLRLKLQNKVILDNINLSLKSDSVVTLIGPNGAGKSTLVKCILNFIKPTSGDIIIAPGIKIGYMPQKIDIEPLMPINVQRFLSLTVCSKENFRTVVAELKIAKLLMTKMQLLSGGELQRVLLAKALLREPELLILDEPVQGVDITGQSEFYELITMVKNKYKCGILMVSHDLHVVMSGTDRVVCLNKHICCDGMPEAISEHPEFIDLFGDKVSRIAVYTHHHNHEHDLDGNIKRD